MVLAMLLFGFFWVGNPLQEILQLGFCRCLDGSSFPPMKENLYIQLFLLRGFERSISVVEVVEGNYRKISVNAMSFSNVVSLLWWVVGSEFVFWDRGHSGDAEFVVNVLLELAEPEWAEDEASGAKFAALSVHFGVGRIRDSGVAIFATVPRHCGKVVSN
jgi:hypothetical protein